MSEWGRVALYYDYEIDDERLGRKQITGLVSKAYKYPGVLGMIWHAYYGINYFLENKDDPDNEFGGFWWNSEIGGWVELCTAFDVFWNFQCIMSGINDVQDVVRDISIPDEKLENYLFNCEGSDGWLFIKYTGNPDDGYSLKYGYFYGWGSLDEPEVGDLRRAMEIYSIHRKQTLEESFGEHYNIPLDFFEENATLMDADEFWDMEDLGVEWVKKIRNDRQ